MKDSFKIVESQWVDTKKKIMIYKTEDGRLITGKQINAPHGSTIFVELSDGPTKEGYYHIINVIKIFEE